MFSTSRYSLMVFIKISLLFIDLFINSFSDFARKDIVVLLIVFIIQDVCLIFAVISIVLSFFSTYIFQAGFIELLYDRFRMTIIICMVYLLTTIALHAWVLSVRWEKPLQFYWTTGLLAMYIIHKIIAVFHYYFYKRSMLRISDPRFYEDLDIVSYQRNQR